MRTTLTVPIDQPAVTRSLLAIVCLIVLCITLTLGLWPFQAPRNQISWIEGSNGIGYGKSGTVLSAASFPSALPGTDTGRSIEIWAAPRPYQTSAALLSFYTPGNPDRLIIGQSLTDLRVRFGSRDASDRPIVKNLYVAETFRTDRPRFLTITSGNRGTSIYQDGALAVGRSMTRIPESLFTGELILGDAPLQPDSWRGKILGLAIFHTELTAAQTLRHYNTWTSSGRPEIGADEQNVALYLFDERRGNKVGNQVRPGIDLTIPERYEVVDKVFLEPFWREFSMTRSFWSSVLKNIVGLIPLGFCVSLYLSVRGVKRVALPTVVFGTLVSVTIEILQWYLPTRDSGTTDIFTNTLGTWVGVLLFQRLALLTANFAPGLLSKAHR